MPDPSVSRILTLLSSTCLAIASNLSSLSWKVGSEAPSSSSFFFCKASLAFISSSFFSFSSRSFISFSLWIASSFSFFSWLSFLPASAIWTFFSLLAFLLSSFSCASSFSGSTLFSPPSWNFCFNALNAPLCCKIVKLSLRFPRPC